jgi:proteasome lid subunit RPN8/RPN11
VVQLDVKVREAMRQEAERCYPREACGFVIGKGKKSYFMPAINKAHSGDQFLIDHTTYAMAEDEGEILAIWHSHPDCGGQPSEADLAGCEMTQLTWLISPLTQQDNGVFVHDEIVVMQPSGFQMPYLGRPYIFGTFDCYSLLVDYYRREFDIHLDHLQSVRIERWWQRGYDIIEDNWAKLGFVPVTDGNFEQGDLLTFAVDSEVANHVAVYVTGDIILHHPVNRLSRRETLGPYWSSKIKHHLRHQSKC